MQPLHLLFSLGQFFLAVFAKDTFKISVLIFGDRHAQDPLHAVKVAYLEVFQTSTMPIGNFSVEPHFIDAGRLDSEVPANRLQITNDVVCGKLLNGSLAVVIYATSLNRETRDRYLSLVSSITYALSFYEVPVIGAMVRDAEFSKKRIYPSFVRPTPAYSDESYVFVHLLNELNYRQVVVMTVRGDANGDQFVAKFENKRRRHKIHVQRYVELELQASLNDTLHELFEEVTSNIVVMLATKPDAEVIFEAAGPLLGRGRVWIMNEEAAKAKNVPDGVIASRLSQTPLGALRDAFKITKEALQVLAAQNETLKPPVTCKRENLNKEWTNIYAPLLYRSLCSTSTAKIMFNQQCERINVDYEIVNYHEGPREVGSLREGTLKLNEAAIYWADGGVKPLEISLPKHLRTVTAHDPPFVYITEVADVSTCSILDQHPVQLGDNDWVVVPGPWYPCPRYDINKTTPFCCAGYAIDLLSKLSENEATNSIDTSFTFSLHLNDSYGSVLLGEKSGYYLTGALGELDEDLADIAVGGISINPEREKYVDFSEPWLYHGIKILEKSIPRDSPMRSFLQPLKSSLWTALLVSVVAVGLAIFCLDFKSPFDRFYQVDRNRLAADDPFLEKAEDDRVTFGEAMWFVWGVLLNSGVSEKTPRSCSARVLGIVWCGFCMIMVASYTANLAAFLVLDQPEKGLTGVTDPRLRNPSANFSFATVLNSNVYQYFKRHVELSTMSRKMETHNVRRVEHAIQALINGSLDAFIFDSTRLEFEAARHCELRTRGALFGRSAYGIALQKNSPWTPHITSAILKMSESGVMETLDAKWIGSNNGKCAVEIHKSPARLGLSNMKDVFILVTGGVAAGALMSFVEVTYGRRKARLGRQRSLARRYGERWRKRCCSRASARRYPLPVPIVRRGYGGLELLTQRDWVLRDQRRAREMKVFKTDLQFGGHPTAVYCSRCRRLVETVVVREVGAAAVALVVLAACCLLWPCAPLPLFLRSCADFAHHCPVCQHTIGRYRKWRSCRFYV